MFNWQERKPRETYQWYSCQLGIGDFLHFCITGVELQTHACIRAFWRWLFCLTSIQYSPPLKAYGVLRNHMLQHLAWYKRLLNYSQKNKMFYFGVTGSIGSVFYVLFLVCWLVNNLTSLHDFFLLFFLFLFLFKPISICCLDGWIWCSACPGTRCSCNT